MCLGRTVADRHPRQFPTPFGAEEGNELHRRLSPFGRVALHSSLFADRQEFFRRIAEADVVLKVRGHAVLDEEVQRHAPRLRLISIAGTGTEGIDLAAATRRGIAVTNVPAVGAQSVAELTFGLMLGVARAIALGDRRVRNGAGGSLKGRSSMARHLASSASGLWGSASRASRAASVCR